MDTPHKEIHPLPAARTRAESLRLQLEKDIVGGRLRPGQKLDEEELASRYGLSRTPVREAIKALSSSGLLEIRQHQGAFVVMLTLQSLSGMLEMMTIIETSCAEFAAQRFSEEDRSSILAAKVQCEEALEPLDPKAFYEANISFHDAIYVAAHNDYLIQQARALRIRLEPYRRQISFAEGVVQQSLIEHEAITEAIFERNAQLAASAMKAHTAALSNDITSLANLGVSPMELIFR